MLFHDLIRVSLRHVIRNKIRAEAAAVTLSLGVAGIMVFFTMGEAIDKSIAHDLELVGRAVILKCSWNYDRLERWHHGKFTFKDVASLEHLAGVDSVAPFVSKPNVLASRHTLSADCQLLGVGPEFFRTLDLKLSRGRQILRKDVEGMARVCVIGPGIMTELFAPGNQTLGSAIFSEGNTWEVVGVLGGIEYQDFHNCCIVPLSTAQAWISDMSDMRGLYIRACSWDDAEALESHALKAVIDNHPGYDDAIHLEYFPERIKTIRSAVFAVKVLLIVSLIVVIFLGGLGIFGMMMTAVQERTAEIGLRRAVGASTKAILSQFLVETVAICLAGAVQGLVLGSVFTVLLNLILDVEPEFGRFILGCIVGLCVGVITGVVAGIIPAWKASRSEVLGAMRFE